MTNPFEALAAVQMNGAQKAKERSAERVRVRREERDRPPTELEKKQAESAILLSMYRKWRAEVKASILERHRDGFAALLRLIRNLEYHNVHKVLTFVESAEWLLDADEDTKFSVLRYIDESICRSRIRQALPTWDDIEEFSAFCEGRTIEPSPSIRIIQLLAPKESLNEVASQNPRPVGRVVSPVRDVPVANRASAEHGIWNGDQPQRRHRQAEPNSEQGNSGGGYQEAGSGGAHRRKEPPAPSARSASGGEEASHRGGAVPVSGRGDARLKGGAVARAPRRERPHR